MQPSARADVAEILPIADYGTQGWRSTGTPGSYTDPLYTFIDEPQTTPVTTNSIYVSNGSSDGETSEFTMGNFTLPAGVSAVQSVTVNLYDVTTIFGGTADSLSVSLYVAGAYQTAVTVTPGTSLGWQTAVFNGSWTQTNINNMRVKVTRNALGSGSTSKKTDGISIATMTASVSYIPPPYVLNQAAYRWFSNADSATPGAALTANQNTVATAPSQGTPFRLRLLLDVSSIPLPVSGQTFTLQYATRAGTCDASFAGETYADISASVGDIRFYDNATPTDGVATTSVTGDPSYLSHPISFQNYEESAGFTNKQSAIATGSAGLWDFSLVDYSAAPGTSYCFRATKSGATPIDTYTVIPEITTVSTDTGKQYKADHISNLPLGSSILGDSSTTTFLDFSTVTDRPNDTLIPQVEIQPIGTAFTGTPNYTGIQANTGVSLAPIRYAACSAYDSAAKRMLIFGGKANDDVASYNDTWALYLPSNTQPSWAQLSANGAVGSPPIMRSCAAAYDSTGNRFIVWDGWDGTTNYNQVWSLSLGTTPTWTQLCSTTSCGTAPSARHGSGIIYDPINNQLVAFGGMAGSTYLNDTWKLSLGVTPAWTKITPTGGTTPPVRSSYGVAYDPDNRLMWISGGTTSTVELSDVWKFNIATNTWTIVSPDGCPLPCPARAEGSTLVYDSLNKQLVAFGGYEWATGLGSNAFSLLGNLAATPTWSNPTPNSAVPEPRYYQTAVYDPLNQRMVAFAGKDYAKTEILKDLSALYLPSGGVTPYWRGVAANNIENGSDQMMPYFDTTNQYAYIFGGFGNGTLPGSNDTGTHLAETHRLDLSTGTRPRWKNVSTQEQASGAVPLAREASSWANDTIHHRLILFGGMHEDNSLNDAWIADMPTDGSDPVWRQLCSPTSCGTAPPIRWGGLATYDPTQDRLIIFGGINSSPQTLYNDVWALSLGGTPTWTQLSPSGTAPTARWGGTTVYDAPNNRMIVQGGQNINGGTTTNYNDTWALSLGGTPAWSKLSPSGVPPLANRSAAYTLANVGGVNKLIVFGGYDETSANAHYNQLAVLDLSTTNGSWLTPFQSDCNNGSAPACRRSATGLYNPTTNKFIVVNGRDANGFFNDVYTFDLTNNTWGKLNPYNEIRLSVPLSGLADGSYHWQYRTNGTLSGAGNFTSFGANSDTVPAGTDFSFCRTPTITQRLHQGTYFCGQTKQYKYLQ